MVSWREKGRVAYPWNVALIGNYLLVMFLIRVLPAGCCIIFYSFLTGKFSGLEGDAVDWNFNEMLSSPSTCHHDAADHDCRLSDLLCWSAEIVWSVCAK